MDSLGIFGRNGGQKEEHDYRSGRRPARSLPSRSLPCALRTRLHRSSRLALLADRNPYGSAWRGHLERTDVSYEIHAILRNTHSFLSPTPVTLIKSEEDRRPKRRL